MDIIDKIRYYQESAQPKPKSKNKSNLQELAELLQGTVFEEKSLPLIKRESYFSFNHLQIDGFLSDMIRLPLLTKGDFTAPINVKKLLFFDLETTGLAGGTGTYPFLIGIAFFENDRFKVVQYFLPEYDRDIYAYLDIKKNTKGKTILASFNGKSYDYPLLKNRFILNRFDDMFKDFRHIDLLHLSRRIWKNSLDSCSLGNIEQKIFKFSRLNDIEGYLIPNTYFSYLQNGNINDISNIIFHNEQDLVSLARLIIFLSQLENETKQKKISNSEIIALLDNAVKLKSLSKAKFYYDIVKMRNITKCEKSLFDYSLLLKKHSKWEEALEIWEILIDNNVFILSALEELSKFYEHRKKDYLKAQKMTLRALKYIEIMTELNHYQEIEESKNRFNYRNNRLKIKLMK
jgi:uncharacterized protein